MQSGTGLSEETKSIWDIYKKVTSSKQDNDWLTNTEPPKDIHEILNFLYKQYCSHFINDDLQSLPLLYVVPFQYTEDEVKKSLSKVSSKKSPGSDQIPSVIWSKFADILAKPLSILFNQCLSVADLPSQWKCADIIPLPKSKPISLNNTRPISLLPIPERIFEKRLLLHYRDSIMLELDPNQFGFRPRSSTLSLSLIHI